MAPGGLLPWLQSLSYFRAPRGPHPFDASQSAIKTAERQAGQIESELGSLDGQDPLTSRDRERITKDLRARLDDWRGLLRRHVPQARQILRKLLVDCVVFTPRTDHYEFVGPWTLGKLVSGVVDLPQGMASPRGWYICGQSSAPSGFSGRRDSDGWLEGGASQVIEEGAGHRGAAGHGVGYLKPSAF